MRKLDLFVYVATASDWMEMILACSKHVSSDGGNDRDVFKLCHVYNAEDRYRFKEGGEIRERIMKIKVLLLPFCCIQ